jgi:hypothetical protein
MTIFAQIYIDEDVDILVATLLIARGLVVLKRKGYPELFASMESVNLSLHENI